MTITIITVENPIYSKSDNSEIDCIIQTEELGRIPYTSAAHDNEPHGKELWIALKSGIHGIIAPYKI